MVVWVVQCVLTYAAKQHVKGEEVVHFVLYLTTIKIKMNIQQRDYQGPRTVIRRKLRQVFKR